jgi:hypothetical protein
VIGVDTTVLDLKGPVAAEPAEADTDTDADADAEIVESAEAPTEPGRPSAEFPERAAAEPPERTVVELPADGAAGAVPAGTPRSAAGLLVATTEDPEELARRIAGPAEAVPVFTDRLAELGAAAGCSGAARRMASVRRSAVTGPGADSDAFGIALPVPATRDGPAGTSCWPATDAGTAARDPAAGWGAPLAGVRTAAAARATDRRSAAATPTPLCWETAPALAARAGVELPLPVEFPGGADPDPGRAVPDEPGPAEPMAAPDPDGGACRGARNLRCSCELVIGPAAVTSSIRRTGMAVDTSAPAMVPGDRG